MLTPTLNSRSTIWRSLRWAAQISADTPCGPATSSLAGPFNRESTAARSPSFAALTRALPVSAASAEPTESGRLNTPAKIMVLMFIIVPSIKRSDGRAYGRLFPGALEGDVDAALVQWNGAQFEQRVDRVLPVDARDLRHIDAEINFLGDDGMCDAQGRLAKVVAGFEARAFADQEFNDFIHALIGSAMQCCP